MILFLDIDTRQILDSKQAPFRLLELKRRDTDIIELQFLRAGVVQELAGTAVRIGIKPSREYDSAFYTTATFAKFGVGTATKYLVNLNLNTVELGEAFSDAEEPELLSAMLEIEWATGSNISSSKTLSVSIFNDVIRGDEGAPQSAPLFYTSSTQDFRATQAQAAAGTDNNTWMTPLRVFQGISARVARFLPAPRIVFSDFATLNVLKKDGLTDGTFNLLNAPQAIAADLPQAVLDEMPVFLELLIFKKRASVRSAFVPPPWQIVNGQQVWQHPWPQTFPTRTGRHTVFNGTSAVPVTFSRPNHLAVTTSRQTLPAWQTLHGRWSRRPIDYIAASGATQSVTRIVPCGNRSTQPSGRAWSNILAPFRCAWRFVAWHAESQSILAGPMSPVVIIRPDKAPFYKTTTSGGAPAATVNAGWTGNHVCSFF